MLTINGVDDLKRRVSQELGVSEWVEISQDVIDAFADVTDDDQFIHVDPERAKETPFGGTIGHGLLTLSLGPKFSYETYTVENVAFAVNYGYDKVRFPAPVPVGSKLRARILLASADDVPGGVQCRFTQTFEVEGGAKPVCVAEHLIRFYAES